MKSFKISTLILLAFIGFLLAEEQPPFAIKDPSVNDNFVQAYTLISQIRQNDGTHIFVSSADSTQFNLFDLYAGSVTIPANASVIVAVSSLTACLLPMFTEQNTSSKTVSCVTWLSSFTLTNTSGADSKIVNWLVFGRKQ